MPKPTLTRDDMERVIVQEKGGVLFHTAAGPKVVTRVEDLPDEAELAGEDEEAREHVRQALLAQQSAIQAQINRLDQRPVHVAAGGGKPKGADAGEPKPAATPPTPPRSPRDADRPEQSKTDGGKAK